MTKLLGWLRAALNPCKHSWIFVKMTSLTEILSSKEYSLQRCTTCGKEKYRKL